KYDTRAQIWTLGTGELDVVNDSNPGFAMHFEAARDRFLTERPIELMARQRPPQELTYRELSRNIVSLERSGSDANQQRVERALKIAIPFTCIIIALFGAPLATSNLRGGSASGVAVSLATTMILLPLVQLTPAI